MFEVIKMHSKKWGSEGVTKGANCVCKAKGVSVGVNERVRRLVDLYNAGWRNSVNRSRKGLASLEKGECAAVTSALHGTTDFSCFSYFRIFAKFCKIPKTREE